MEFAAHLDVMRIDESFPSAATMTEAIAAPIPGSEHVI
jgi:hypothetical protein